MKSVWLTALFILLMSTNSFGQSCNCTQEFNFVKNKIEINYAGFGDKVITKTKSTYDKHTLSILKRIQSVCILFRNI